MSISLLWHDIQDELKTQVGQTSYDTWFTAVHVNDRDPDVLEIETPDDFFKNWIVDHYQNTIEDILVKRGGIKPTLLFSVNKELLKSDTQECLAKISPEPKFEQNPNKPNNLNTHFTFDNFVIGPSNRFACAAGLAVAESPAKAYNPLFIYGQVGLGKTHLIQAITHKIRELNPALKIQYMTSEKFTNELIDAIRHRSTTEFRKKYRNIDVLLIDDVHFIAGKESTQEEFFHTFNFLHENHKQIIITSDRPPREISKLEERLSSRFSWGLITDIQAPDFETRAAILRKKAEKEPVNIPDDIIIFIAEQIQTNIRELEGALIRVAAYSVLEEKELSLDVAKQVLKDMLRENAKTVTPEQVLKVVSSYYNIDIKELKGTRRNKNVVTGRQIAMYLIRTLAHLSLPEIGTVFGGKDHTTVLHSCRKIEQELTTNSELKNTLNHLSITLQQ